MLQGPLLQKLPSCTSTFSHRTRLEPCSCQLSSVPDPASSPNREGTFLPYHLPLASEMPLQELTKFLLAIQIPLLTPDLYLPA